MPFQPGKSGNPGGRPKRDRAFTQTLIEAGQGVLEDADDTPHQRRVAELLWAAAASGWLRFPDERTMPLDPREWFSLVRWLYLQIDGPPATRVKFGRDEEDEPERLSPDEMKAEIRNAVL